MAEVLLAARGLVEAADFVRVGQPRRVRLDAYTGLATGCFGPALARSDFFFNPSACN
jgi:hypothetical protein